MEIVYFILLFVVGIVTGIYSAVAGGGALMLVPAFLLIGTPVHIAIGTMRAGALVQEALTSWLFWRRKYVTWRPALWTGFWSATGGLVGAHITVHSNTTLLSYTVAGVMLVLLFMLPRLGKQYEVKPLFRNKYIRRPALAALGFILGVYGGFYGAGFGTLIIFGFAYVGGWNMLVNVANARVVGFMMSLAASIIFFQSSTIDWGLFVPVTGGVIIGSVVGVNWAAKFGSRWVKIMISVVVIASVIKLIFYT